MATGSRITTEGLREALAADFDFFVREVADAVSDAPEADFIGGSEMQVYHAGLLLRQKAFERALQLRVEAAEAAFSPSGVPQSPGA